ncbi:MAG: cytochrome c family protein [Nanoarchaeota archaeon]|nr:cytochrome c family protein [Nanoarchaeota archaeon]
MYGCKKEEPPIVKVDETTYDEQGFAIDIRMENPAYEEHTKGIMMFSHKKHFEEYKIGCGECHHDENNEPLELKIGDPIQGCIECHTIPGKWVKDSGKDKLDYHADAIHQNCKECHTTYNKENNTRAAPTTCVKCHPRK